MNIKLNCILLVDDDSATNFIHKVIFSQLNCAEEIDMVENGMEALEYLQNPANNNYPQPDLILLDINMPVMNGWEFLEKYQELDPSIQGQNLVLMLTAPLGEAEMEKARNFTAIRGYMNKPLNTDMAKTILKTYFEH